MKKSYEVEKCECGKEAPIEFMVMDEDGLWSCPDCRVDYLQNKITEISKIINDEDTE